MRRRLALGLTPLVIALALMLPTSVLAGGGYSYTIKLNYCTNYPAVVFKVRWGALGTTNANKLTIDAKGQTYVNGKWQTYETWPQKSVSYTPNGADHSVVLKVTYLGDAFADNRVVFRLRAWHNSNLLNSQKVISRTC